MITIHHQFTHLFKEWFSMIIDDETMTARIDDSFTPVIEQNGYEISFANLSGGEKQRLALARGLMAAADKPVVFLDEPTSNLDHESEGYIQEAINELVQNRTVIIIAHKQSTINDADKVIAVENGEIIETRLTTSLR